MRDGERVVVCKPGAARPVGSTGVLWEDQRPACFKLAGRIDIVWDGDAHPRAVSTVDVDAVAPLVRVEPVGASR